MRITAITRYKHGIIYELLTKLGWTQKELADRAGLYPSEVGEIVNLRRRPRENEANKIQAAFGEVGEYFDALEAWPETFVGSRKAIKREETADIDPEEFLTLDNPEVLQLEARTPVETSVIGAALDEVMDTLKPKEKAVLVKRFYENKTLREVTAELGYIAHHQRAGQIEASALRKLRHPKRMRRLSELGFEPSAQYLRAEPVPKDEPSMTEMVEAAKRYSEKAADPHSFAFSEISY